MADLATKDVVNEPKSAGDDSSVDASLNTTESTAQSSSPAYEQILEHQSNEDTNILLAKDDLALDDTASRSDTDSPADGSNAESKVSESKSVKRVPIPKPVSFVKYSVPKVIEAAKKAAADKVSVTTTTVASPAASGRPRLVAKTTSSLQQNTKSFKSATPDPLQVWNKNRSQYVCRPHEQKLTVVVTPQPSTKNLTDEELKQQYGIHLTTRLQTDGDGKESKWADIDDDEDDWAPETIEWGDGTKTSVTVEPSPPSKSNPASKPSTPVVELLKPNFEKRPVAVTNASIGPNATVLKLGQSAERVQAQRAAQQAKGSAERPSLSSSQTTPAPVPAKSPWAKLPPVDKVAPIEINPQPAFQPPVTRYPSYGYQPQGFPNPSPAREISADDFYRGRHDSAANQAPALFMPGSGRYEPAPENKRRMSKNEGFRAPAVLQRPGMNDSSAPEPSPAFQTTRTSSDAFRRRASSGISGESGQIARRMSIKHADISAEAVIDEDEQASDLPTIDSVQQIIPVPQVPGADSVAEKTVVPTEADIQAQRVQQRGLMKEQADLARKRRKEEEDRLEAEKQERIRQKLASLGPDPKILKLEQEAREKAEVDKKTQEEIQAKAATELAQTTDVEQKAVTTAVKSPPKPPQPHATGAPQQYGMMKVHALDSVKQQASANMHQAQPVRPLNNIQNLQGAMEEESPEPPTVNGIDVPLKSSARSRQDLDSIPEPIPRHRAVQDAHALATWTRNQRQAQQTSNLWGPPNARNALGNGTFDQALTGYAPQDLSSRASSTGQGWMNGRSPTVGQSPQLSHSHQHVPETRSQTLQNMTAPEAPPLSINSEADSMLPVRPPVPIGPPPSQLHGQQAYANGYNGHNGQANVALAGWNNFHNNARVQERAQFEQQQREANARREEEKRTGLRPQPNYTIEETFKQVHLDEQTEQRVIGNIAHINLPPPQHHYGAVGSLLNSNTPQISRGSRFFPPAQNSQVHGDKRVSNYVCTSTPRSPSPPPAEEYAGLHPVYERLTARPVVRLPQPKAVVKLPPTVSLPVLPEPPRETTPPPPQAMSWAARVAMAPPKPQPLRTVATPIVQTQSWQERFNGLLSDKARERAEGRFPFMAPKEPAQQIRAWTRMPLEVYDSGEARVSLPMTDDSQAIIVDTGSFETKDVEAEEDLFEDRENGSLPSYSFPTEAPSVIWPRPQPARVMPMSPDIQSARSFMTANWKEEKYPVKQFAIIKLPGSEQGLKRDIEVRTIEGDNKTSPRHVSTSSRFRKSYRGGRARPAAIKA